MSDKGEAKGQDNHSKGIWIKILVPVLIVIVVAGIFIFKNPPQQQTGDKGDVSQQAQNSAAGQESEQTSAQATGSVVNIDIDFFSSEFDLDATEDFDLEKILSYGLPVVIDFGSDSCIPCQEMAPILSKLNEELRGKVIVIFVDVSVNPDAGRVVPLRVIPTQFFFDANGKPYVPHSADSGFVIYNHKATGEHMFTAHEGGMTEEEILAVLEEMGVEW